MVWGRMNQKECSVQQRRKLWELPMKEIGTKGQGCTCRKTRSTPPSSASFVKLIFLQNIFQKTFFLIHGIYLAVLFHGGMQIYLHTTPKHCWSQHYAGVEQDVTMLTKWWTLHFFTKNRLFHQRAPLWVKPLSGALYLELITISSFFVSFLHERKL